MARRSYHKKSDKSDIIELEEQVKPLGVSVNEALSRVSLKLQYPVRYVHTSKITGERYEWSGAGSTVSVNAVDAPILLIKYKQNGCCGSSPQRIYLFTEV
jgi:hypothetical protein